MLLAISVIHKHGIAHRDIKPENFLFESPEPGAELKLIDFGLSEKYLNPASGAMIKMKTIVGTTSYIAPEIFDKQYGPE
jgi:calcium-dependent protein kinase